MKAAQAVIALAALAQDTRLAIYRLLVQAGDGGKSAGAIAERLGLPGATLSFHLKELAHAGLIDARQHGRFIFYSANYARMNGLIDYLTENCCEGEGCVTRGCDPPAKPPRKAIA
ncbi:MAG TPA: metalloregulator ArsR/SmtB family transcription factor [Casimicrobiaceae bacterium]|jgi:DNA-binding transcriptional ArsR family regulator|nr:metalloregulator ArsR/SmtB family transcription factor [Casimicrobiaceae bacterium]